MHERLSWRALVLVAVVWHGQSGGAPALAGAPDADGGALKGAPPVRAPPDSFFDKVRDRDRGGPRLLQEIPRRQGAARRRLGGGRRRGADAHLKAIQELDLSKLDIGLAGAQALAASPLLRTLKYLWLNEVELTSEAEKLLRQRFGDALQMS